MNYYEQVLITKQSIADAGLKKLIDNHKKTISSNGGEIHGTEDWGLKQLQHNIKGNRKGYYFLFYIKGDNIKIHDIESAMLLNEDIIRFLTTKIEKIPENPSPRISENKNVK